MTTCIVLDGWHKGHVIDLPHHVSVLRLPRPAVITYCDDYNDLYNAAPAVDDYVLAFQSLDRKTALYTAKGNSDVFRDNRDWFVPRDKAWKETPLYIGCHDPRAVLKDSKEATTNESWAKSDRLTGSK